MHFLKGAKAQIWEKTDVEFEDDLGTVGRDSFKTLWRTSTVSERLAVIESAREDAFDEEAELRARLVDWKDLKDADGEPVAFTPENLGAMLDVPAYRKALMSNLKDVLLGRTAAKN